MSPNRTDPWQIAFALFLIVVALGVMVTRLAR